MQKPIPNFENYEIYDDGRVYSHYTGQFLSPTYDRDGYCRVALYNIYGKKFYLLHRLVAQNFIPNPLGLPEVNHKNMRKSDNRVENLEWCAHQENSGDLNLTIPRNGQKHPLVGKYDQDNNLLATYKTYAAAARELEEGQGKIHTKENHISLACNGKAFTNYYLGYYWKFIE